MKRVKLYIVGNFEFKHFLYVKNIFGAESSNIR